MEKLGVFLLCAAFSIFLTAMTATAQQAPVPLGTSASYAVLAGDTITNTGATTINGNLGLSPGTSVTGGPTVIGASNVANAAAILAKTDLRAAFLNAAGRAGPILLAGGALGGRTLTPGLYKDDGAPASLGLTGTLTLDFQGNPNAVFIFQSASTLITAVGSRVVLINTGGGTGCNVFWQAGSAATFGAGTIFVGTILANDDISVAAGATVAGRSLAGAQANGAGALTLNNNAITASVCGVVPALTLACPANVGQVAVAYSAAAVAGGGTPAYTFSVASGALPAGLTLNAATGAITGTPATAGRYSFTARVTDSLGATATNSSCGITVAITPPSLPATLPDLTITKNHTGDFQQGGAGSYTLTVKNVGSAPTSATVTVTDTLPAGLTATSISGTGWTCTLLSRTCTRGDALAAGATYPPVTVTVNVANNPSQLGDSLAFQSGDILLSMADGAVQWRRRDWTLAKTITGVSDGQAKGMAFDASGNLFLTHYFGTGLSGNSVVKFDRNGILIGLFGNGYNCNPSTIVFDMIGNAYVGHADCSGGIFKLDSQGNRLAQYDVAVESRGSSHILLDPNRCTIYYTSMGPNVKRFNVCTNTQMPDFNSIPLPDPIGGAHQFAMLPGGGLLVANFSVIARLDASGNLVRTYDAPADTHCWLGMALDPDGTSFWATNWCGSSATRFDIATGNVIDSHVAADPAFMVKQIIVAPPNLRSIVLINTASVSGGGEVDISNNSASDSTTIIAQAHTPVLSIGSTATCVGAAWSLGVTNALPNASVRLIGTTDGQSWVVGQWGTADANGSFSLGGVFAEGSQGSYTLKVEIDGKMSNTVSFVVSNCRQ